jgi:hypothetical protein
MWTRLDLRLHHFCERSHVSVAVICGRVRALEDNACMLSGLLFTCCHEAERSLLKHGFANVLGRPAVVSFISILSKSFNAMMHFVRTLAILCWSHLVIAVNDLDSPQSLYKADIFLAQRACAQTEFDYNGDQLGNHVLNCVGTPALNKCYCRADLQSIAVSWLSSDIYQSCTKNKIDMSSATSIYLAYCTPKISPSDVADAVTSTSSSTAQTQSTYLLKSS